jgi:uncharacterized protein (UPF0332 family)
MHSSKTSGTISAFCALPAILRDAYQIKKFKPHAVDWAQIERFLTSAEKKLSSAQKILAFDEEACLQQAYEAMLKASLGFLFSHGSRARSQPGHHIAINEFVRARIDKKHAALLTVFDRLRRKRNTALYDDTGLVSRHDAEQPLKSAHDYLDVLRADIAARKP